jgi:hypothetical protein
MRFPFLLSWFFLFLTQTSSAFIIKGVVTDLQGEKLAYTNIHIKGTTNGTSANVDGQYQFDLPKGKYEVVFQHIGYKQQIIPVDLQKNMDLNVSMEVSQYIVKDVLINGNEDPAIAIIKKAIEKRKYFLNAVETYSCDAYVKGVQRLLNTPGWAERRLKSAGLVIGKNGVVYLSESQSRLYYKKPNKFHEVIYSSKVSGSARGFTFNSAQNFFFNFYERNISIPIVAQRPFISPLSENAFFYYNFHMLGAYTEGDRLVNKIQVTPKRKSDPCFNGVLSIVEDNWNIHSLELFLTKNNGMEYLDTLRVTQYFVPVVNDLWLPTQQRYDASGGVLGIKGDGYFLGVFRNYVVNDLRAMPVAAAKIDSTQPPKKIEKQKKKLEKKIDKKVFTPEIVKIEKEANTREEAYWDSIRPVPLTEMESSDYEVKDSIEKIKDTKEFKDSTDKVMNRPGVVSIITGYTFRKQNKKLYVDFPSLLGIVNFNTVEGVNFQLKFGIRKIFDKQRRISFEPVVRYGLSNRHFNAMATLSFRNSQVHDEYITLSGGKFISQFNEAQPQPEFGNTWHTLVLGRNFMKLYEQYFVKATYGREIYNGIDASFTANYMQRFPLENTKDYTFFSKYRHMLTPNGMDLPGLDYSNDNITRHNNFRLDLKLHFTFGQQFITRPDLKFRVGSKYPELDIVYKRAIAIKGFSDLDYDFLEAQLYGTIPLKIIGTMFYRFGGGGFPSRKRVDFADYKHFFGNFLTQGTTDLLGFYTINYYRHSTDQYFAEAHLEHHFGGFLFNKIPGIRTLKLDEVIGFHFLYTPTRQQYFQVDAGIANIFKIVRVDFVAGFGSHKGEQYYGGRMAIALVLVR